MLTKELKSSLEKSLAGNLGLIVVGKTKAANEIYEILITSKEIKKEAYVIWNEQWNLEIGLDENVKVSQTLKGTIRVIAHYNEEGCAELNATKKVQEVKLNIEDSNNVAAIVQKTVKVILDEREDTFNELGIHQELVKDVTENRLKRKFGKIGAEYKWDHIL